MSNKHASIREIVEFGLDTIPESETVEVSLRGLVFLHQVLGELNRFFHQPEHYRTVEDVIAFMGTRGDGGAFEVVHEAYYTKLRSMIPPSTEKKIEAGDFEHPKNPEYYDPKD